MPHSHLVVASARLVQTTPEEFVPRSTPAVLLDVILKIRRVVILAARICQHLGWRAFPFFSFLSFFSATPSCRKMMWVLWAIYRGGCPKQLS